MPFSRRRFLALSGASLGIAPWLGSWADTLPAVHVLFEPVVTESVGFATALPALSRIALDLNQPHRHVDVVCARLARGQPVLACTREAARFITCELLQQAGYRHRPIVEHRRVPDTGWRHAVTTRARSAGANDELVETLAPLWEETTVAGTSAAYGVFRAAAGPAYLVTWVAEAA